MAPTDTVTAVTGISLKNLKDPASLHQRCAVVLTSSPVNFTNNRGVKPQPLTQVLVSRKYRHVAATHCVHRASCLSHESQAVSSFLGFRNLMVIVLIAGNLRLMIENFIKDIALGVALLFIIPCHLFLAYIVELIAAQQARSLLHLRDKRDGTATPGGSYVASETERCAFRRTWSIIAWVHGINASTCLLFTSVVVYYFIHHPLIGCICEFNAIIVWLKTASYGLTNRDLRRAYLHPSKREEDVLPNLYQSCPYPTNITLGNLTYFWWAPTLVYQPVYPRSLEIRWNFVAKRLFEMIGLNTFMWIASAQYAAPLLRNSLNKMVTLDFPSILERLMKFSTISLVIWLAGFFAFFQSFLNALAEITRFADREFYTDWWNSPSVGVYWRSWNKPVYNFMKRHIYSPLVARGWAPWQASVTVFLFSALLHELLVGIPTHNIIGETLDDCSLNLMLNRLGVAFIGMMCQLPLIAITAPLVKMNSVKGKIVGNCIFWVSFTLIGQPLAVLLYFFAWQSKYGTVSQKFAEFKT